MSQPTADEADNNSTRPIPGHTTYLMIAAVSATMLVMLLVVDDVVQGFDAPHGTYALLALLGCATFFGYLNRSAVAVLARQNELKAADADEIRRQGYATGYVDGTARLAPDQQMAQVHLLNGRASR